MVAVKGRGISLFLMVLSLAIVALVISTPGVVADPISVTTDQPVHAFGQSVTATVSYLGGVHGDVKVSLQDAAGAIIKNGATLKTKFSER